MIINKTKDNVVVIFAKKPEKGRVKTRIAEETSENFAYGFVMACLADLIKKINNSNYYDLIVGVDTPNDLLWFQKYFSLEGIVTQNNDREKKQEVQSNKFEDIFSTLLGRNEYKYKKAILIPMDTPFISTEDLITAFVRLDQKKFVHGPETNGGVYLIGIRAPYRRGIFKKVRWSTSYSFSDLIKNCDKKSTFSLKLKNDLNVPEDIIQLRDQIHHNCPGLYKFLEENGYYLPTSNTYINFDNLSLCIPIVSNIVERRKNKNTDILIQIRYKPTIDPKNTGKIEIPSGLIKRYELAHNAALRETKEETGITAEISDDQNIINMTKQDGSIIATYKPFYCHQQISGDRAYLSIGFISKYKKGEPMENLQETRKPRWISLNSLKRIVDKKPKEIFPLSLALIKEYLKYKGY